MKQLFSSAFLIAFPSFFSVDEHKFYVSTTIIEQNVQLNSLEITIKLFSDDLEQALQQYSDEPIRLGDKREHEEAERWVEEYIRERLNLNFNDHPAHLTYIGKEIEYDLSYVYFELTAIPEFNVLTIDNQLFFDLFEEQVNIVHLRLDGWEKTLMLDRRQPELIINR